MKTDEIFAQYDQPIATLGFQLRDFLFNELNGIAEMPDRSANIIGYGFGPGYKEMICTIIPSKRGIKLGVNRGGELPDPKKLLTGTGKVHRYVEIKSEKDIRNPALKKLLQAGVKAYHKRMDKALK